MIKILCGTLNDFIDCGCLCGFSHSYIYQGGYGVGYGGLYGNRGYVDEDGLTIEERL